MKKLLFLAVLAVSLLGCPGDEPGPPAPAPMLDMAHDVEPDVDEPTDEPDPEPKARPRVVWSGGSGAISTTKHQGQLTVGPLTTVRR